MVFFNPTDLFRPSVSCVFLLLTACLLITVCPVSSFAHGKTIVVGATGNGSINYPNAQATLNLKDDDTVVIKAGKYKQINFGNITASPGHRITIINGGLVEIGPDKSASTFFNLANVDIRGDGVPGINFGFYMHDLDRGIEIRGTISGVYFSYFRMANMNDYGIFFYDPTIIYSGTNSKTSLYYDIKFLHFNVSNIRTTFLQMGLYKPIMEDGLVSMFRKVEVAYCTVDNSLGEDVMHLSKVMGANVHHNRFSHMGVRDNRHTGIIYLYGNGEVHHNHFSDYWGSGLRAHGFSLDTIGKVDVYNNIMTGSRKYSGVEVLINPGDIAYRPFLKRCNFRVYNNTFGNLSGADWQAAMVDNYDISGGVLEIKNNLGFNIERDKPFNAGRNYIYSGATTSPAPDTANNLHARSFITIGLKDDVNCTLLANSPAVNKGRAISFITDDIAGVPRPQGPAFDIGAREFNVSQAALPVILKSFTAANKSNNENQLNWETTTEITCDYFTVERSADGVHFGIAGNMPAAGTSSLPKQYQFIDVFNSAGTDLFYRLKMVDKDGTYTYSNILKLKGHIDAGIIIFPNPAGNTLTINGANEFKQIQITDCNGKLIRQLHTTAGNQFNIGDLQPGVYLLRFINDRETVVTQLVKK